MESKLYWGFVPIPAKIHPLKPTSLLFPQTPPLRSVHFWASPFSLFSYLNPFISCPFNTGASKVVHFVLSRVVHWATRQKAVSSASSHSGCLASTPVLINESDLFNLQWLTCTIIQSWLPSCYK